MPTNDEDAAVPNAGMQPSFCIHEVAGRMVTGAEPTITLDETQIGRCQQTGSDTVATSAPGETAIRCAAVRVEQVRARALFCAAVASIFLTVSNPLSSQQLSAEFDHALWAVDLGASIQWQRPTMVDVTVTQTEQALYGIDGATGQRLWEIAGLRIDAQDVNEIGDLLILNVRDSRHNDEPHTMAVDTRTGRVRWRNESLKGRTLILIPFDDGRRMILANSRKISKGMPSAIAGRELKLRVTPELYSVDVETGHVAWKAAYPRGVDLFKGLSTVGSTQFTIDGLPEPKVHENALLVPWSGLTKYDLKTGRPDWVVKYNTSAPATIDTYHTNAFTVVDHVAYTSAVGVVRAIDLNSGTILWTVKGMGKAVPQLLIEGTRVYAKAGGVFYQSGKSQYLSLGKPSLVAIGRTNGSVLWRYTKVDDATTNAIRWDDNLVFANAGHIYGVGSDGVERFRHPLHLGSDRPYLCQIRGDILEVRSEQHRAVFDLRHGVEVYTVAILKPETPPWKRVVVVAARYSAKASVAFVPAVGQMLSKPIDGVLARLLPTPIAVEAQKPAELSDNERYDFFLAAAAEDKQATTIVRVDRLTGQQRTLVRYGRRGVAPDLDMTNGRMYSAYQHTLAAHSLFARSDE